MKIIITKKVINNILCCLAVLLPLQINSNIIDMNQSVAGLSTKVFISDDIRDDSAKVVLLDVNEEYCDTKCYLSQNIKTVEFLTKTFGVNKDEVINDLIEINKEGKIIVNNIGRLTDGSGNIVEYSSFERGLVEYLYVYTAKYPERVDNTYIPYTGGPEYVENLIKYFTKIYDNVDYNTVISIGAAESGYYKVAYMLSVNNVYGGMGSGGLIRYKTIEYGILSYVRYLSVNYYAKGLNTVESIGYVYCPTRDANGNKIVSPHWVNLVYKAKAVYADTTNDISVEVLNS